MTQKIRDKQQSTVDKVKVVYPSLIHPQEQVVIIWNMKPPRLHCMCACIQISFFFIQAITRELRDLKTKMQGVMEEKENLNSDNQEVTKRRAKLELMIKDIQDELEGDKSARVYIACFTKTLKF